MVTLGPSRIGLSIVVCRYFCSEETCKQNIKEIVFVFPRWHIVRMIDIYRSVLTNEIVNSISNTDQRQEINMYHTLTASLLSRNKHMN